MRSDLGQVEEEGEVLALGVAEGLSAGPCRAPCASGSPCPSRGRRRRRACSPCSPPGRSGSCRTCLRIRCPCTGRTCTWPASRRAERGRTPSRGSRRAGTPQARPLSPPVAQGCEDPPFVVADEVGDLEPNRPTLVARSAVVVRGRHMTPPVVLEKRGDPREVVVPDGHVDVRVRTSDRARVEVDRPAAEEPVRDPCAIEELGHVCECGQLVTPGLSRRPSP